MFRGVLKHVAILSETNEYATLSIYNHTLTLKTKYVNNIRTLLKSSNRIYRQKIRKCPISYKTYNDLAESVKVLIQKLPAYNINLVIGIPRSGMIPAYMIGAFLNIKVASLDEFISGISTRTGVRPLSKKPDLEHGNILIVDDSVSSGSSIQTVKERLMNSGLLSSNIIFSAVYATKDATKIVDYYGEIVHHPRLFQWNYLHHGFLEYACVDIDGVLCVDPTPIENDDGDQYLQFLKNAKPLYKPEYKIYALVTSRLEKYRPQTEIWLKKHGIQYEHLYMLDLPSAEDRRRLGSHASFKAEIYSSLKSAELFIESDEKQAETIALIAKKPVICVATDRYYSGKDGE